ncbi:subtilisin-like protein [Aureobasidium sp. EXF-10727]|nr:subtilisin-like protein [Aureobasidium sp. EXF-10727]
MAGQTAILLIDPYNDFLHPQGKANAALRDSLERSATISNLQTLLKAARLKGIPVFYCLHQQTDKHFARDWTKMNNSLQAIKAGMLFEAGSQGAEYFEGMGPDYENGDVVVSKHWNSRQLQQHKIDHVVVAGLVANTCMESTARDAYEHGYALTMLSDCTAGFSQEAKEAAVKMIWPMFATKVELLVFPKTSCAPTSAANAYAIKESHHVPRGWSRISSVPDSHSINLHIGLRQGNQDELEQHVLEISNPSHERYGQHLSATEVQKLIAPPDESVQMVNSWLLGHGIETAVLSPSKDWIASEDPSNGMSRRERIGGNRDQVPKLCNMTGTNGAGDIVTATSLDCLRCLYGTSNYVVKAPEQNMIGVTNYLNQTQKRSDIRSFLEKFRPEAAGAADTFPIISIAGAQDNQGVLTADQLEEELNLEGDLDGELVLGISWPTSFLSWSTGGSPPFIPDLATPTDTNEPYLEWLTYVLAQDTLPQVISTSYGDDEQSVPYSYAKRVCDGFKQLGARGISVLFSSGDDGVGADGTCFSNTNTSQPMFLPAFPASCPWVTTVGGTAGFLPEVAVSRFGSGAGFSNYFSMPAYQTNAVEGYLDKIGNLYQGLYNRSGRGYPDVAAQGNHDIIVWEGNITTVGGTSASSPTFAAVIALVNDALIAAGKPPLGFLNPWLYRGAFAALTDITSGSSIGCNTSGFPAEVGWDAVTGFGTPNLGKLIAQAFHAHKK